jgi:hypothetical protein
MSEKQLEKELKTVEAASKTKEASELLAKFVKDNEAADPLISKQADNPYNSNPSGGKEGCCVIS